MTNNNRKGKEGEREVANLFKDYGLNARRSQQYCGANSDSDVEIEEYPVFLIEVKRVEALNIHNTMNKAKKDAEKANKLPVVVHRKDRTEWLVTMRFEDWIKEILLNEECKQYK